MELISDSDNPEPGGLLRAIEAAWNEKDYRTVLIDCESLLKIEPDSLYALIYQSRAAVYTENWLDVEKASAALVRQSPRDAFNAARKLNQSGRALEAARIFIDIDIRPDWFDAKIADLAWKEGVSLLSSGLAAINANDVESAKILWVAGLRIAPRSQQLRDRVTALALEAKAIAQRQDLATDPNAYLAAWRELLWFYPTNTMAATKIARACERGDEKEAVTAWVRVLDIDPNHEVANERLRKFVERNDLESYAIRALVEMGRDENSDPLIGEFAESRDEKARIGLEKVMKARLREAMTRARSVSRADDPKLYLEMWKKVLALNPKDLGAVKKVISCATELENHSVALDGLIAHLEITPGDTGLAQRLAKAGLRAREEARALDYLAKRGLADFSVREIASLLKRVVQACKTATKALEFDQALASFHVLELADDKHPALESIRPVLARKAGAQAKEAERQGDLEVAVPLAEKVLRIDPDQLTALTVVARDLLRHRKYGDLVELCGPRVKPQPEYASLQKLLDKAAVKMAA